MAGSISWIYAADLVGTSVFAISGALAAGRKQLDIFGVVVLAMVTAVGGGTLRDMMLDQGSVFWLTQTEYLWVVLVSALVTVTMVKYSKIVHYKWLEVFDAAGLAVFTVIGVVKAQNAGLTDDIALIFGIMTGCFGGLIRDVLANDVPHLLRRDIYATASLLGGLVLVFLGYIGANLFASAMLAMAVTFGVRLSSLYWGISLPTFNYSQNTEK